MGDNDAPITDLSVEECWLLLESEEFGRLAYRLVDEVHLVPINYVLDGRALYFRTAEGSKLLAAALQSDVAFEVDWRDEATAWSVVARGRLRQLDEFEQHRLDFVTPQSWLATDKPEVIELIPAEVTGRRVRIAHTSGTSIRSG